MLKEDLQLWSPSNTFCFGANIHLMWSCSVLKRPFAKSRPAVSDWKWWLESDGLFHRADQNTFKWCSVVMVVVRIGSCRPKREEAAPIYRHHAQRTNMPKHIILAPCTRYQYTNIYYTSTAHLFLMLPVHIPQYTNKRCWACFTQQYQMHTTFTLNQFQAQSLLCIKESGMQDEILKKRLEPETKIVGIFWCKFFRADSNFANLKRILGLFLLIWGIFTKHYFFGAKFPRQKVLIFMFCMFRPWTIVIYTQSAPFFNYIIWNLGWPILNK